MNAKSIFLFLSKVMVALAVALTVQGCANEMEENITAPEGSGMRLSVCVATSNAMSTRAGHTDSEQQFGSDVENHIDFDGNDFRLALFDSRGNHLIDIDCDNSWVITLSQNGNYVYYRFDTELVFPETTPEDVIADVKANGIQVMALANWRAADSNASYDGIFTKSDNSRQTLGEIWADDQHYNFAYPVRTSNTATWVPSISGSKKSLIPMFGIGKSTKFTPVGSTSNRASVTVPLQRAMAKVEIIDNIDKENPGTSFEGVAMSRFNTSGRFIPNLAANPNWDKVGQQVDFSSVPFNVSTLEGLTFVKEGTDKWIAYIPEMYIGQTLTDSRPHVEVKLKGENKVNKIHFAQYDEDTGNPSVADESWEHILRNHIYRFVAVRGNMDVKIHLEVVPWYLDEEEIWDFTDNISLKPVQWLDNSYDIFERETGEIYLSFDTDKYLEGTFQLMSPIGAKWYATLVPLDGATPGAVTFCDRLGNVKTPTVGNNPEYCPEVSGTITGTDAIKIYLRPTDYGDAVESRFRLEFFVENLGVWQEVQMADQGDYENYIIIRKANLIN